MTGINWNGGMRNNHARSGNKSRYQQSHQNQNQFSNKSVNKAIQGIRKHGMKAGSGGGGKKSRQNHQNDRIQQQFNFPWATEDLGDQIEESETYLEPISQNRWNNESQMRKKALEANNYDLLRKLEEMNQVNDIPDVSQVLKIDDWSGINQSTTSSSQDPLPLPIPSRSLLPSKSSILSNPNQFGRDLPPHFYLPTPTDSFYANPNSRADDVNFLPEPQAVKTLSRYDSKTAEDELNAEIEREKRLKEVLRSRKNKLSRVQQGEETQSSLEEGEILEFRSSPSPTSLPLFRPIIYSSDDMEEVDLFRAQDESEESDEFYPLYGGELKISSKLRHDSVVDTDLPLSVSSPIVSQAEFVVTLPQSVKASSLRPPSLSPPPSPPPQVEPSIQTSYFEALAASISNFEPLSPSFFAPQRVQWNSVCCLTTFQRQELSRSWKFKNRLDLEKVEKLECDLEEGKVLLGERMGIGCLGIKSRDYGRYDAILRGTFDEVENEGESEIGSDYNIRKSSQMTSPIDSEIQQDSPLQPSSASKDDSITSSFMGITLPQPDIDVPYAGSDIAEQASAITDFDSFYHDLLKSACVDVAQSQAIISRSPSPMEISNDESEGESLIITTLVSVAGIEPQKEEEVVLEKSLNTNGFEFDIFSQDDTYGMI